MSQTAKAGMRYGFWLPVFGGWLRNVDDEKMAASWEYVRDLAKKAEIDWLRSDADCGIESERHQGCGCSFARCVVDYGGVGCGDGEAGVDGCGEADVS